MSAPVIIANQAVTQMQWAAARSPQREICGLLLGYENTILTAIRTPNIASNPKTGFAICPAAHCRAQRQARQSGHTILGCFHSHPSGDTSPSQTDLLAVADDKFLWAILAPTGGLALWRAYYRSGLKRFDATRWAEAAEPNAAIGMA